MTLQCPSGAAVFVFVPFDGTPRQLETRLRESLAAVELREAKEPPAPAEPEQASDQELPCWTWFLPNPWPKM